MILDRYNAGESVLSISYDFPERSYWSISEEIKASGIAVRGNDFTARKYRCNETYFDHIDSESKAYWLGFIYADGYVQSTKNLSDTFGLALARGDREHIQKLQCELGYTGPIHDYIQHSGYVDGCEYSRLTIRSNALCDSLRRAGVVNNKTLILKFPCEDIIPADLLRHFIRGYFDGDGCLTYSIKKKDGLRKYAFKVCGTKEMVLGIENAFQLKRKHKLYQRHVTEKNTYCLDIGGNDQVDTILKYMFENASVYLDRKYQKYLSFLHYRNSRRQQ